MGRSTFHATLRSCDFSGLSVSWLIRYRTRTTEYSRLIIERHLNGLEFLHYVQNFVGRAIVIEHNLLRFSVGKQYLDPFPALISTVRTSITIFQFQEFAFLDRVKELIPRLRRDGGSFRLIRLRGLPTSSDISCLINDIGSRHFDFTHTISGTLSKEYSVSESDHVARATRHR